MKVLWLCNIALPKIAEKIQRTIHFTGGWLVGLSEDLLDIEGIDLTICSPISNKKNIIKGNIDNLSYYCFPQNKRDSIIYNKEVEKYLEEILKEVQPDIIHIFGTEYPHTLSMVNVCEKLGIIDKVIINIQGLVSIIEKHYYAGLPNNVINRYTIRDVLRNDNIKKQREKFRKRGIFEIESLKKVKHVIGRTDWDRACVMQINPNINYHFCNETLRNSFYDYSWSMEKFDRYSIFLSQGSYPVKGLHFMIEAMPIILNKFPNAHIYLTGNNPLENKVFKDKIRISSYQKYIGELIKKYKLENKITFLGNLDEKDMCNRFLNTHVFVSPSVIENESNSLSEAKILGVPSVASFVGGVTNRMNNGEDGFHYQHDAPYMLAHHVCEIFKDDNLAMKFSKNARKRAQITHNRINNLNIMIDIYRKVGGQN